MFVLDQHALLDFYSASTLKQQSTVCCVYELEQPTVDNSTAGPIGLTALSTGRHVTQRGHIFFTQNKQVLVFTPK